MNAFPRRSPRFQQQSETSQATFTSLPSYGSSRSSSTNSTSHPSPTSDDLNLAEQQLQQSQFLSAPATFAAPLPSPSANDIDPFGRLYRLNMSGQAQTQNSTSTYQNSNTSQSQTNHQQQHHNSFSSQSQSQRPNYPPTSTNGVPPGLPPDFLAEAAKRAQMACLMRDLGDVAL